jgi:hypothetical protein
MQETIMAKLTNAMPTASLTTDDLRFLSYVQHMALTAQSEAARQMFQEYMQLEKHRLTAPFRPGMQAQDSESAATGRLQPRLATERECPGKAQGRTGVKGLSRGLC